MATKFKAKRKLTAADVASLGRSPEVSAVRSSVDPKTWRKLVDRAHHHGVTVEGFLSGAPHALQERTRQSIAHQARHTINAAYAPAEAALTQQETRTKALDEKRKNDNAHYLDWLNTQSAKTTADAKAADSLLAEREKGLVNATAQGYQALHQQAVDSAAAQAGTVSDFGQAKSLDLSAQGTRAVDTIAAGAQQGLHVGDENAKHQATLAANNFATIAASEAKRSADTWKSLSDIGDEKVKLKLKKAADSATEVSRLLDQEITKANSNRDYAAAAAKLGLQADTLKEKKAEFGKTFGLANQRLSLDQQKLAHTIEVDGVKLDQADRALNQADTRIAQGEQNVKLGWYRARHPHAGPGRDGKHRLDQTNQFSFDHTYAQLAAGTRAGKNGKGTHPIDAAYVRGHEAAVIAGLIAGGVNKRTAHLAVAAFLALGGSGGDPGSIKHWIKQRQRTNSSARGG